MGGGADPIFGGYCLGENNYFLLHIGLSWNMEMSPAQYNTTFYSFSSWTYDGSKLKLEMLFEEANLSSYEPDRDWELIEAAAKLKFLHYECCPEYYPLIQYTIHVKKKNLDN